MKTKSSSIFAVLLIVAAVVIILSSFGLVPAQVSRLILSWQMIFVLIAIVSLSKKHLVNAGIFLVLAVYFMAPLVCSIYGWEMPLGRRSFNGILVATLVLVVALGMLFGSRGGDLVNKCGRRKNKFFEIKPNKEGVPQISCAFGEANHMVIERPFKGAVVSTAFGATTFNMSKTVLPEGDSYLEVNTAFGGAVVIVPSSWVVSVNVQSFFGGVDDKREFKPQSGNSRLIIRGSNAFGGLEIKASYDEPEEDEPETQEEVIDSISVKHNNRVLIVALEELFCIQADGDYVTLCTAKGNFLKEQTMKYFQGVLPADRFVRIHRSCIVNLSEINSVDCRGKEVYYVTLKNGQSLRASTSGYQILKERLGI